MRTLTRRVEIAPAGAERLVLDNILGNREGEVSTIRQLPLKESIARAGAHPAETLHGP